MSGNWIIMVSDLWACMYGHNVPVQCIPCWTHNGCIMMAVKSILHLYDAISTCVLCKDFMMDEIIKSGMRWQLWVINLHYGDICSYSEPRLLCNLPVFIWGHGQVCPDTDYLQRPHHLWFMYNFMMVRIYIIS